MMPMESGPEDFARRLAEQQRRMQEAHSLVYYAHSRTGILACFLQQMADRIDPTGEARRSIR